MAQARAELARQRLTERVAIRARRVRGPLEALRQLLEVIPSIIAVG
jgi:hypothetical protein